MDDSTKGGSSTGLGIGSVIAFILSYCTWHSIGWAFLHGLFGWMYIFYFAIMYTETLKKYLDYMVGLF